MSTVVPTPTFIQASAATPQTSLGTVAIAYPGAQASGDTNIVAIGWNDATSTITSVTDSAGNAYQSAAPTARGPGVSQAIYFAPNIRSAAAGANTVTVVFGNAVPYADVRITEYSGLDASRPFDATATASGTSSSASSGNVSTAFATELIFGAGVTTGGFSGFRDRVHDPSHHRARRRHRQRSRGRPAPAPTRPLPSYPAAG